MESAAQQTTKCYLERAMQNPFVVPQTVASCLGGYLHVSMQMATVY